MRHSMLPPRFYLSNSSIHSLHKLVSQSSYRRLIAFVATLNLLLWPGSAVGARDFLVSGSDAGSQLVGTSISYLNETLDLLFFRSLFRSSQVDTRPETVADRNRLVSSIEVSPHKLVGYVGDNVTFVAMGLDIKGQPAHGAKFSWASSDSSKLKIDDSGRARLVASGLVEVTARAGNGERTVPVMIKPTRRLM